MISPTRGSIEFVQCMHICYPCIRKRQCTAADKTIAPKYWHLMPDFKTLWIYLVKYKRLKNSAWFLEIVIFSLYLYIFIYIYAKCKYHNWEAEVRETLTARSLRHFTNRKTKYMQTHSQTMLPLTRKSWMSCKNSSIDCIPAVQVGELKSDYLLEHWYF